FNPVWIGIAYALSLVYQFFIHTTLVGRFHPAIEWLFNTPSHHRVHHGRNPGYIDRNYGGVLIIWDRLFGTFVDEDALDPPEYGITNPVPSKNLLTLWTHEYRDIFRDMRQKGSLWTRLQHLWRPPEWERPARVARPDLPGLGDRAGPSPEGPHERVVSFRSKNGSTGVHCWQNYPAVAVNHEVDHHAVIPGLSPRSLSGSPGPGLCA